MQSTAGEDSSCRTPEPRGPVSSVTAYPSEVDPVFPGADGSAERNPDPICLSDSLSSNNSDRNLIMEIPCDSTNLERGTQPIERLTHLVQVLMEEDQRFRNELIGRLVHLDQKVELLQKNQEHLYTLMCKKQVMINTKRNVHHDHVTFPSVSKSGTLRSNTPFSIIRKAKKAFHRRLSYTEGEFFDENELQPHFSPSRYNMSEMPIPTVATAGDSEVSLCPVCQKCIAKGKISEHVRNHFTVMSTPIHSDDELDKTSSTTKSPLDPVCTSESFFLNVQNKNPRLLSPPITSLTLAQNLDCTRRSVSKSPGKQLDDPNVAKECSSTTESTVEGSSAVTWFKRIVNSKATKTATAVINDNIDL